MLWKRRLKSEEEEANVYGCTIGKHTKQREGDDGV